MEFRSSKKNEYEYEYCDRNSGCQPSTSQEPVATRIFSRTLTRLERPALYDRRRNRILLAALAIDRHENHKTQNVLTAE